MTEEQFSGIAPMRSDRCEAKAGTGIFKRFLLHCPGKRSHAETDLLLGIRHAALVAQQEEKPLVILISLAPVRLPIWHGAVG